MTDVEMEQPHTPDALARRELKRQQRLVDQAISMQSWLRDRDQTIGTILICTVLVASLVGVAFAFAGTGNDVTIFGVDAQKSTWLGWLAVGTGALTLVDLVLDRRAAARRRADAVRLLSELKAEYRADPAPGEEEAEAARLSVKYEAVMAAVPAVPERSFNRLKAAHLRKVEVSKILSAHPGVSLWRARWILRNRFRRAGQDSLPSSVASAQSSRGD